MGRGSAGRVWEAEIAQGQAGLLLALRRAVGHLPESLSPLPSHVSAVTLAHAQAEGHNLTLP